VTRLLCATDLLAKSENAVDRAGLLAEELGAHLSLLHVVSPTASERVLEQSLQIAIARMRSRARPPLWRHGPAPNVLVRTGNPARLICDAVEQEKADLLILGPHERREMLDGMTGTIAEKVLAARKCPLLLVREQADESYRNVLLALDLSAEAALAVRAAESLVLRPETKAMAIHVFEPPLRGMLPSSHTMSSVRAAQAQAAADVHELLSRESADSSRYEVVVEEGHPITNILRAVEIHRPQLLVMGTRAAGRMRRALLGSVASRLMKEIDACDMLIVPRRELAMMKPMSEQRATASTA
jgi:universal stress protein E